MKDPGDSRRGRLRPLLATPDWQPFRWFRRHPFQIMWRRCCNPGCNPGSPSSRSFDASRFNNCFTHQLPVVLINAKRSSIVGVLLGSEVLAETLARRQLVVNFLAVLALVNENVLTEKIVCAHVRCTKKGRPLPRISP